MEKKKLKVGLLIDDFQVPKWVSEIIKSVQNSNYATLNLVIVNSGKEDISVGGSRLSRIYNERHHQLYYLYQKIESKISSPSMENALDPVDFKNFLSEVPSLHVVPRKTKFCDFIEKDDIEKIKLYDLDVLIRFGFRILKGEIFYAAKYGVWSHHHGDNDKFRGMPAGAWEVINNYPCSGAILQIINDDLDAGRILYKSIGQTRRGILENRNALYWKSVLFVPRVLKRLYSNPLRFKEKYLNSPVEEPAFFDRPLYSTPRNVDMIKYFFSLIVRKFRTALRLLFFRDQWSLFYFLSKDGKPNLSFFKYKELIPPSDRFWADPCIISHEGKVYAFIEEYIFKNNKGHISVIELNNKKVLEAETIIQKNYHLSYPFVFDHQGKYYLIPESSQNDTVELYECVEFPLKWKFVKNLMEGIKASDTTVLFYKNKCWLFANVKETENSNSLDELFLFYADSLFADVWHPHPLNPIVSDIRSARPAGKIFGYNGELYRPSQISVPNYGSGVAINWIKCLDEYSYEEETIDSFSGQFRKDVKGAHTLSIENGNVIIDAIVKRNRLF